MDRSARASSISYFCMAKYSSLSVSSAQNSLSISIAAVITGSVTYKYKRLVVSELEKEGRIMYVSLAERVYRDRGLREGRQEGLEKGKLEGKLEIARKMKVMGILIAGLGQETQHPSPFSLYRTNQA